METAFTRVINIEEWEPVMKARLTLKTQGHFRGKTMCRCGLQVTPNHDLSCKPRPLKPGVPGLPASVPASDLSPTKPPELGCMEGALLGLISGCQGLFLEEVCSQDQKSREGGPVLNTAC